MNEKEMKLALDFLDKYEDVCSDEMCNDYWFPKNWTEQEQIQLCKEYHEYNGDPEEFEGANDLNNFMVVAIIAAKLRNYLMKENK